jgi:hypothetical protein
MEYQKYMGYQTPSLLILDIATVTAVNSRKHQYLACLFNSRNINLVWLLVYAQLTLNTVLLMCSRGSGTNLSDAVTYVFLSQKIPMFSSN